MPDRRFLEEYPLYRKFSFRTHRVSRALSNPAIHMFCPLCESGQTFTFHLSPQGNPLDCVLGLFYLCRSCQEFVRHFFVKFDPDNEYVMKVGQEPP